MIEVDGDNGLKPLAGMRTLNEAIDVVIGV
jgi:hypothetical protein